MKGLFIKDLSLLTARKSSFVLYFVIVIVMSVSTDQLFSLVYGMFLFGMVALSTVAYDEIGGGMAYLMTLPVTAKDYVTEKHIFCGLASVCGFALSAVLSIAASAFRGESGYAAANIRGILPVMFIYLGISSVMIFIDLKFGVKNSRTVMIILYAVIFSAVFFLKNFFTSFPVSTGVSGPVISPLVLLLVSVAAGAVLFTVFYLLSLKAMNDKEY